MTIKFMWFVFALLSGMFLSLRRLGEKPLTGKLDYFTLGWTTQLFSLPLITIIFLLSNRATSISQPIAFWFPLFVIWFILYPVQTYCYFRALHTGYLSEVVPILSFVPIFIMIISVIVFHQTPSTLGLLGTICTISGVLLLNVRFWKSLNFFRGNSAALFMLISSISTAIGSTLDKVAISASHQQFYTLVNVIGATTILILISALREKTNFPLVRQRLKSVVIVGIFASLFYSSYTFAVAHGVTSYVVALRNTNILVSAALGIFFFKEKLTRRKLVSYVGIGCGILLLAFA